jgi:adenylosuccinate lyase
MGIFTSTLRTALHNTFRYGQGTRDMAGEKGLTTEEFGWAMATNGLFIVLLQPLAVSWAERFTQARVLAEGLTVDAPRMRRNLESTGGLIVAEAVMMGLAPVLGRGEAHHVVHHACDVALAEGISLAAALARDATVSARLSAADIATLTDPAGYLGMAGAFVDRVLARV